MVGVERSVEHLELETPFGCLRGITVDGVTAFHRVPYAEAPIGPRRFELAGPAPRWRDTRDATVPGPVPPQLPSRLDSVMGTYEVEQSEDCLHLDIWTTHRAGDNAPVLVFLHGGAFMTGGGSLPCYDGSVLARENGLVVVNITSRLGLLGFWPGPDFGELNLGLHDQAAALRWIREAISCFGGDPARITVIGQSAGAFSIAAFLGTDLGRDLFSRAIIMSAPVGVELRTVETARPLAKTLLDVLGLADQDVDRLRTMSVDQILGLLRGLQSRPPAIPGDISPPFMPVLDSSLIPRDPVASIQNGSAQWCDIMIGVTREEYAAFSLSNPTLNDLSENEVNEIFKLQLGSGAADAILKIRSARVPAIPRTIVGDLYTDKLFTDANLAVATAQAKAGRNVFSYRFDWQSPVPGLGACHCIDLPFLFGNIDVWRNVPMLKGADRREVEELSRRFRGAIAAFAKSGEPNGTDLSHWPAYTHNRAVLHFDRRIQAFGSVP
ncbi:para-nitrobenzyl esterase [Bradyrhizobium sp. S3.3.6]|uniref:carboxylesterase/lipase family protein n=1 Tax=Bradyrhizobium sp. S3.3.6 TaxID=3156429 RepID=UPI0033958E0E